jgi:cation-transporting ATPase 13A1
MELDASLPFSRLLFLFERPLSQRTEHLAVYAFTALAFLYYCLLPPEDSWGATVGGSVLAVGLVLCAALFLVQEWFVDWRRRLSFSDAASPLAASHVFVQHACPLGATPLPPRIVRVEAAQPGTQLAARAPLAASGNQTEAALRGRLKESAPLRFRVHGSTYEVWGPDAKGAFRVSSLPVPDRERLATYLSWGGWSSYSDTNAVLSRFGPNKMEVPVPEFFELAWEHAVAPFFVFQLGCVALWCLDEYVFYSLFTLGMLTFMEGVLVSQRIMTARMLRGMRPPLQPVYALRGGGWVPVKGEDLVPLDVISLHSSPAVFGPSQQPSQQPQPQQKSSQHMPCPADVLLLKGTVVVNEAMLTGESTPQLKEDIGSFVSSANGPMDAAEVLNAFGDDTGDRSHGRSIVFAGTLVMTSSCPPPPPTGSSSGGGGGGGSGGTALPPTPDGGCPGIVVRVGPYTSQGELMRSIMSASTQRNAVDSDAFVFLGVMLVFALASSGYVLYAGLGEPGRDRWKLVLHCIMIITTVIPPELPVQLSLCTNASLAILAKRGIFCTEPARIPKSGNVNLVAFDKTGTLTADEFTVTSVVCLLPPSPTTGNTTTPTPLPCTPKACPAAARLVLAGCHALSPVEVEVPGPPPPPIKPPGWVPPPPQFKTELAGEPLEKAALRAIGWTVSKEGLTLPLPPVVVPALDPLAAPQQGGAGAGAPPPPQPPSVPGAAARA